MDDKKIDRGLEVWKTAITVQQHFNDIEMKIRNYALTLLLAVLGAAGIAVREEAFLSVGSFTLALGAVLLWAGLLVWIAFYFMDAHWYHRLLLGAVGQAMDLENELTAHVPGIGLSNRIKDESAIRWGRKRKREIRSADKIRIFYWGIAIVLIALSLLVSCGVRPSSEQGGSIREPAAATPGPKS